jgi:hypothetical protein
MTQNMHVQLQNFPVKSRDSEDATVFKGPLTLPCNFFLIFWFLPTFWLVIIAKVQWGFAQAEGCSPRVLLTFCQSTDPVIPVYHKKKMSWLWFQSICDLFVISLKQDACLYWEIIKASCLSVICLCLTGRVWADLQVIAAKQWQWVGTVSNFFFGHH